MDPSHAWPSLLPRMRWFAGKGRTITSVTLAPRPWCTRPGSWPAVREEALRVAYADGAVEDYHLVSAYRRTDQDGLTLAHVDEPGLGTLALSDATADPEAFAAYLASVKIDPGVELWERPLPLAVEQSNSSVRIATNALIKVIRRPQPGGDREITLLQRLSDSGVTPRVFGSTWDADGRLTGVVIEFVASVGDGWQLATAACRDGRDFSGPAAALGRALREVHRRLARPTATEPGAIEIPGATLSQELTDRLRRAAVEVPQLADLLPRLLVPLQALADSSVIVQPIHGDFHLGQALYRADGQGWSIIDFEGEPLAPIAQRNRPDSPWRDVAGALRSFDYVRGAQPDPHVASVRAWSAQAQDAFLSGYADHDPLPDALLRAYVLDKAVYEVRYETQNRPEWVQIPLETVQDELTGPHRREQR